MNQGPAARFATRGNIYVKIMAELSIITAPDQRLKQKSAAVAGVDDALRQLMDDMVETMHAAPGIGLAAPQVGILKRVIVVDVSRDEEPPQTYRMANPELLWVSEEEACYEEGCLSVPDYYAEVARPDSIRLRYLDYQGAVNEMEADGLLATCIQHEIDHLDGLLFVDHISALKRKMILRKLLKARKTDMPVAGESAHIL